VKKGCSPDSHELLLLQTHMISWGVLTEILATKETASAFTVKPEVWTALEMKRLKKKTARVIRRKTTFRFVVPDFICTSPNG
jgi:hypothetical protein